MPDLGWASHIARAELSEWLRSLTVSKFTDESGQPRYFVTDFQGDLVGEAHNTPEAAFDSIDALRENA